MHTSNHSASPAPKADASHGLSLGIGIGLPLGVVIGVLTDNIGVWLAVGLALGVALGLMYDERQKTSRAKQRVKILDGATYTLTERTSPAPGQRTHYWLGDNGREIELTEEEDAGWER
jgi:hypothetical protein